MEYRGVYILECVFTTRVSPAINGNNSMCIGRGRYLPSNPHGKNPNISIELIQSSGFHRLLLRQQHTLTTVTSCAVNNLPRGKTVACQAYLGEKLTGFVIEASLSASRSVKPQKESDIERLIMYVRLAEHSITKMSKKTTSDVLFVLILVLCPCFAFINILQDHVGYS